MNMILKFLVWVCGAVFIIAFFNSLIGERKVVWFRNFMEKVKVVRQHRPDYLKGFFGRLDLARYGVGLPQTREGVLVMFFLLVSILVLTFLVVNYL